MKRQEIALIKGDGIGPEITDAVVAILAAAGAAIDWIPVDAGLSALDHGTELIPQDTLDTIGRVKVALKGPCTTPVGEGFTSVRFHLRHLPFSTRFNYYDQAWNCLKQLNNRALITGHGLMGLRFGLCLLSWRALLVFSWGQYHHHLPTFKLWFSFHCT